MAKIHDEFSHIPGKTVRYFLRRKRDKKCIHCGADTNGKVRCNECSRVQALKSRYAREDVKALGEKVDTK